MSFSSKTQTDSQKKTTHQPKAETEEVQIQRVEYWQQIREIEVKNLVFLDETGLQLGMTPHYARSEQGKRAYGVAPYPHGQMITLIGAITVEQVMTTMTVNGGTDGRVFHAFVTQMLVPHLWSGACVVADNLPAPYRGRHFF